MNNRWRDLILICSLLFNLFLAGFIFYHLATRPIPQPPPPRIDINREQMRERHQEIRMKRAEFIQQKKRFTNALAAAEINEFELREQLDILLQRQIEMEREIGLNLIEMRKNMNDVQAEQFFRRFPQDMRERHDMLHKRR